MTKKKLETVCKETESTLAFAVAGISDMAEVEVRKALKMAIRRIEESGGRYRTIIEAITSYIYTVNIVDGRAIETIHSPACEAVTGYTAEEFASNSALWFDMIPDEDQYLVLGQIGRIFTGQKIDPVEHRIIRKDGQLRWIRNTPIPFYNEKGTLVSYDGIVLDITERKTAEIELQKAHDELELRILDRTAELMEVNARLSMEIEERKQIEEALLEAKAVAEGASKAKSEFVANMSHEIRTPMNAIIGMTNLALQENLPPKISEYLDIVKASSNILLGVINDILDFSRIESGKLDIEKIKFNLHDILTNLLAMFKEKAKEHGIEFCLAIDDDVPDALLGDPLRLGQVLVNLVGNAIKFTREGTVSVTIKRHSGGGAQTKLVFAVSDTGIGISPEKSKHVFESFCQEDGSITRNFGGSGLGLTISRQLVGLMGGEIEFTSTLGKGSVFSFVVPFDEQPPDIQGALVANFDRKILVVDDEVMVLAMLKDSLALAGFEVATASLPSVALAMLSEHQKQGAPFDLVIMDYMMPEQDGFATSKMIKNDPLLAHTPIIMQTGFFGDGFTEQRAKQAGINVTLFKPVGPKLLLENIRNVLQLKTADEKMLFEHEKSDSTEQLQGITILLVEDNKFNQMLAQEVLMNAGLKVRIANNGKDALDEIDEDIDAILMDIEMPEMDGFETTRLIRKLPQFGQVPIIAMTAHAMSGYREQCVEAGMDDYVAKPFQPEEIFSVLALYLKTDQKNSHLPA